MWPKSFNFDPSLLKNVTTYTHLQPCSGLGLPPNLTKTQHNILSFYLRPPFENRLEIQSSNPFPIATNNSSSLSSQTHSPIRSLKQEYSSKSEYDLCKSEMKEEATENKEEWLENSKTNIPPDFENEYYKARIKDMLVYILNNIRILKEDEWAQKRMIYSNDPMLLELFDLILHKYSPTFKTKDEILKYITRKAYAAIRSNYKHENSISESAMTAALCKRYFKTSVEKIKKLGIDINQREKFLQILFPYRKNCKNTVRYKTLISKLGCSIEFYEDYCVFLNNFPEIMRAEKLRKIDIFASYLYDCMKRNKVDNITHYKRIPWLNSWMEFAHITAQEISVALKVRASDDFSFKKNKNLKRKK